MFRFINQLSSSIRFKLVCLTVLPVSLIFILFELYGSRLVLIDAESAREVELKNRALDMATRLDREFNALGKIADINARYLEELSSVNEQDIYAVVTETVNNNPLIFGAAVAFAQNTFDESRQLFAPYAYRAGQAINTMDIGDSDPDTGYNYQDGSWQWWTKPVASGSADWTSPYMDNGAGGIMMTTYSSPFYAEEGMKGVATVDVELATLFNSLELNAGNRLIVNLDGQFIFHPRASFILDRTIFDMQESYPVQEIDMLLQNMQAGGQGLVFVSRQDRDDMDWFAFYPIASTGWYYIEVISERAILAPVRQLQLISTMKAVASILTVMIVIWFISGYLTAPVKQLSRAAQRVSKGDFSVRLNSKSRDEIGRLIRVFTEMSDMISNREYELAHKVEERTQELRMSQREIVNQKQELEERVDELNQMTYELEIARNQAEVASESKASFLASMSHEIRTPLNGILGMVDLLRQSDMQEEHRKMLQTVSDSGQSLLIIINDILDISKIEAGKLELENIPFSLVDVVESSADTVNTSATRKNLRLFTYVDPHLPRKVKGDPVRIRQILINLIGNGIKFTEQGNVSAEVTIDEDRGDGRYLVRFAVTDTGIGISPEGQTRLFKAFSQAESSTTRKYGGTGLGLSICERLSTMMKGTIGVTSEEGDGSTFYFVLPLEADEDSPAWHGETDLAGLRILIVSENKTEQKAFSSYLEYWKAQVKVITDINECRQALEHEGVSGEPVDVVVMGSGWSEAEQEKVFIELKTLELCRQLKMVSVASGRRTKPRLYGDRVVVDLSPLKRSGFLSAVAIAAGRSSPEVYHPQDVENLKADRTLSVEEAIATNQLILVAEDNATNRDVIGRQLKHLGYAGEFAEDGKLALEAWKTGRYSILLTDCHMPHMDGFELTIAIRELDRQAGTRTPVLAITANALSGEEQNCLNAGMDDYMSKPVDMKVLRDKLRKWLPDAEKTFSVSTAVPEVPVIADTVAESVGDIEDESPVDDQVLKGMFGDDEITFCEILCEFVQPSQDIINEISAALQNSSAEDVQKAAHKLKSASRSIGANKLADLSLALETAGKAGDLDTVKREAEKLPQVFEDVVAYIDGIRTKAG